MKLVVGLGNPGEEYKGTRHNVGFLVIDKIITNYKLQTTNSTKFNCKLAELTLNNDKVLLVKPQTYMNKSGEVVHKIADYYKLEKDSICHNLIVVHDELDLTLGKFKIQQNAGSAGHNGVQSIIDHVGTHDFIRLRIGVQANRCDIKTAAKAKNYLLSRFTKEDSDLIAPVIIKAAQAIVEIITGTANKAMNKYN